MTQTIQAKDIDLRYLIDNFGIQLVLDNQFFREWQENLPEITELDRQLLDKVKAGYLNLLNYPPLLEDVVRMAIVGFLMRNPGNELYDVLRILKRLTQLVIAEKIS